MDKKIVARINEIHRQAFIIDAHFDLTYDLAFRRERGQKQVIENLYLEGFKQGGLALVVSAIFIHDYFLPEMGLRRALDQIAFLHEEAAESPGRFRLCRSMAEAAAARAAGELAIFLSLEGAEPLQNDLGLLRIFYELGVRGLGLVWSRRNYVGDGCFFATTREGKKGGLTHFGVKVVEQAEKLGMFIDLSHLNDEGFWDVIEVARRPLIASHSNCRALAPSMRNLTDDMIRAIAGTGGVVGMNGVNLFINEKKKRVRIADLVDHVDHIARLVGIEHVGIGFDLCNGFEDYLKVEKSIETYDTLKSHADLPEFTEALITRGYSDDQIIAVLGGNFKRVYRDILG